MTFLQDPVKDDSISHKYTIFIVSESRGSTGCRYIWLLPMLNNTMPGGIWGSVSSMLIYRVSLLLSSSTFHSFVPVPSSFISSQHPLAPWVDSSDCWRPPLSHQMKTAWLVVMVKEDWAMLGSLPPTNRETDGRIKFVGGRGKERIMKDVSMRTCNSAKHWRKIVFFICERYWWEDGKNRKWKRCGGRFSFTRQQVHDTFLE